MSKRKRLGERRSRKKLDSRDPDLGYYIILTDTKETEKHYFKGLHDALPLQVQDRLRLKIIPRVETEYLIERCVEEIAKDSQYGTPWIILDRDQLSNIDEIIDEAEQRKISVGWSNPCFEIWLLTYFSYPPSLHDSVSCCSAFGKEFKRVSNQEYDKADKDIYRKLIRFGNEEDAVRNATTLYQNTSQRKNKKPSNLSPATTVHLLVGEMRRKCANAMNNHRVHIGR